MSLVAAKSLLTKSHKDVDMTILPRSSSCNSSIKLLGDLEPIVINLFLSAQDGMLFPGGGYGAVPLMGSVRRVLEARGAVHSKAREGTSKAVPKKAWGWSQTHVGAIGV
jgi:hypothetical protein